MRDDLLRESEIKSGLIFRKIDRHDNVGRGNAPLTRRSMDKIVKATLKRAGYDPKGFSTHSLRSGVVTEMFKRGRNPITIQKITGHKSFDMLSGYNQDLDGDQATGAVGAALR